MKPILTHPSWDDLHKGTAVLATKILKSGFIPDLIIGFNRGGLFPSIILSELIGVDHLPISYSSKLGKGDGKYDNFLPNLRVDKIILVDDIIDSGKTMSEVATHYTHQGKLIRSATLYFKTNATFIPDFYWQDIPEHSPWIIFPHEV